MLGQWNITKKPINFILRKNLKLLNKRSGPPPIMYTAFILYVIVLNNDKIPKRFMKLQNEIVNSAINSQFLNGNNINEVMWLLN